MQKNITYNINGDDFSNLLKEMKLKEEESLIDRYNRVHIPTSIVALIHGVSTTTVCRYAQRGLIPIVDRTSSTGNYKFRLSEVLKLDFEKLKKTI